MSDLSGKLTPTSTSTSDSVFSLHNLVRNARGLLPSTKLNRKNFLTWYPEFRLALETVDIWGIVTGNEPIPVPASAGRPTPSETEAIKAWKYKGGVARLLILQSVEDDFKVDITELPSAKASWEKILDLSQAKGAIGVDYWICQLAKVSYAEGTDLQVHFTTMKEYANQLKHAKFPIQETVTAALMVNSMPDSYDNVTSSLPQDSLLIADVERRFLMENRHRLDRAEAGGIDNALIGCSNHSSSSLFCTNCKKTMHEFKNCWSKGGGAEGKGPKHRGKKKDQAKAVNDNSDKTSEHSMYIAEHALYSNSNSA